MTLAVRGGFDVPATLGSRATHLVSRMGPFGGRALRAGDVLPVGTAASARVRRRSGLPLDLPDGGARLRVVPAAHRDRFTRRCVGPAARARFIVSPQSNRMGYRLDGPALAHVARRRHPVGGDADRRDPGARVGPADSADGGTADDRRLCDDRERDHRRSADCRAARARRLDRVRRRDARRGAIARCATREARARPERRGERADVVALLAAVPAGACSATRRSRRSRHSRSAVPPTGWSTRAARRRGAGGARGGARRPACRSTVLGGGSNVLVADAGIRGLVIRVHGGEVRRWPTDRARRRGLTINGLVRWTINRGMAGLEAWAGTPGTVGGAVYGNAHFKGRSSGSWWTASGSWTGGRTPSPRCRRPTWSSATTAAA